MLPARDLLDLLSDLSRRLEDDHSLDALAQRSGWSKFHLQRSFQRVTRETPKQCVTRLRVQVAAALLAATSDPVLSVATSVGFSSHEVFARAFRRAFGCTPSRYRSRHAFRYRRSVGPVPAGPDHVRLVRSVAPCVGLFRTPIHHSQEPPPMSSVTVKLETLEAQPILFIQRRVANTQLATLFAECFPKLFGHCMQSGIAMAGRPTARYVSAGTGLWTVDCVMPVAEPAADSGEIRAGWLQEGLTACTIHKGPYEGLPETNAAVETWIEENGLIANGPAWESYVTDPGEHPDPADWITEVYWPVARTG